MMTNADTNNMEKSAIASPLIGAGIGAIGGHVMEDGSGIGMGALRGAGAGLGTSLGGVMGGASGAGLGLLLAKLLGVESQKTRDIIGGLGLTGGALAGSVGGGLGGYKLTKALFGRSRREAQKEKEDRKEKEGQEKEGQEKAAAFVIEHHSFAPGEKQASPAREECQGIMNRIYNENPSWWPYGLNVAGHDDLYIIRDKMTKAAAGFVGWQEQRKGGRTIGSYSIGVLPEYRGNGMAKEAVAKVLRIKSAGVDEVRAYIVNGNAPSEALANSLGVPVQKDF